MAEPLVIAETYYSTICRSDNTINGIHSVVKHFHHRDNPRTLIRFRDEVRSLNRVGIHPNITQLLSSSEPDLTITLSLAPGHVLSSYKPSALHCHASIICLHLSRALAHIHALGLIHDDIKAANVVFLPGPDSDPALCRTTLVDFGACIDDGQFTPSGTPWYMAPEFIRRFKGPKTDMWGLGVTMAWILGLLGTGGVPEEVYKIEDKWILPEVWNDPEAMRRMVRWLEVLEGVRMRLITSTETATEMESTGRCLSLLVADMLQSEYDLRVGSGEVVERLSRSCE